MWRASKMLASKVVSPEPEPDMSTMPMMTTAMPTARSMKLVRPKANTGCLGVLRGVCCCCIVGWFCFFLEGLGVLVFLDILAFLDILVFLDILELLELLVFLELLALLAFYSFYLFFI